MEHAQQHINLDILFAPILADERIWANEPAFRREKIKIFAKLIELGCDEDRFVQIAIELSKRRRDKIKEKFKNTGLIYLS